MTRLHIEGKDQNGKNLEASPELLKEGHAGVGGMSPTIELRSIKRRGERSKKDDT